MAGMVNCSRRTGRWTLEDRFASPWHYLPVEVPAGTAGVRVELDYERVDGTVLDLGCLGPGGFRGWSGSARESFVITPEAATPGYLPGEIEAGTWQVMIGVLTVAELAALAAGRGLDFLAVTDHNTVSHHAALAAAARRYGITLLPGQEVTTDGGHAGALGDVGWIDFRREPDDWLDATQARGGLLSVNHPFAGPISWARPMRRRPPLLEVWHPSWLDLRWTIPLSWWLAWDPAAIPVGGSDWHQEGSDAPPGRPTTWVECEGDQPADVLDGLRAGRVAISAERAGPVLLRHDDALVAVDADGLTLAGPQGPCARVRGDRATLPGSPGPHRLLDPAGATLALCG